MTKRTLINFVILRGQQYTKLVYCCVVFERKALRKIFGPTNERDCTWRIETDGELDKLIRHKNTINYVKTQRLSWFGHLQRMAEERMVKKYTSGNRC
jgi:hypothetical protein